MGMEPEGATGAMVTMVLDQDEETQEPLVMRFGTNVRMLAFSMGQTARNTAATPDKIETDVTDGSRHTMKVYKDGNG
ncbi:MAG: hypothetical protein J6I64_01715, partial [Lachnospiraceae bacterium]|nr:hypothetical protein [Lachnospiraceae bacterium]